MQTLTCLVLLASCALLARGAAAANVGPATTRAAPSDAELAAAHAARKTNPNRPTRWWQDGIAQKPDSWYRSDEGRRVAANVLSWQQSSGGWPLMNTTREPFDGDASRAGPWGMRAALIKATVNEIRFLARAFRATKDERCRTAAIGGIQFILDAQYPVGGWPHSVPPRADDYTHYATFNDDMMPDLMTLLDEVARLPEYEPVGPELRARARAAFDRGIDFILRCQVRVNGKLTAWGQQHDEVTFEPRPARAFEPAALAGNESASVLWLLMSIEKPAPEVAAAIEAGARWFRDVQIDGLEVVRTPDDRSVRPNSDASPIWARFYEIGTNRPIFAGRDGVVRYALSEIERERRGGYQWYGTSGASVLAEYERWTYAQRWRDQPPTNRDEANVGTYALPELLRAADGSPVTSAEAWESKRRGEILRLFEQHQHGVTPTRDSVRAKVRVRERGAVGLDGLSRRTQAEIGFSDSPDAPVIRVLLHTPADADGPVPTLLYIGFSPNVLVIDEPGVIEGTAWSPTLRARVPDRDARPILGFDPRPFLKRGYGVAVVYYGDIEPDFDHGGRFGVRSLFRTVTREDEPRRPDEWGSIGAWSWGLSRVLDYLETDASVDAKRVALAGVSRLGKTVLWAGAQDRRFAMVVPILSGEGGAAISRRRFGETIADLTKPSRYDYWFAPRYADYAFDVDRLPVDGHMLCALIAPRPMLLVVGSEDSWSDPKGEYESARAAAAVYALYGKSGPAPADFPAPGFASLTDLGFFMHEGGHKLLPIDLETMADFMDRHLAPAPKPAR